MMQSLNLDSFCTRPFNPYIIVYQKDQTVHYFTQAFSQFSGFHPSTVPDSIPLLNGEVLGLENIYCSSSDPSYKIYEYSPQKTSHIILKNAWVDVLIHELRTATLSMDLGSYLFSDSSQPTPRLVNKIIKASHRQRISTLVASDFIHLISSPPKISRVSLINILLNSYALLPNSSGLILQTMLRSDLLNHIHPMIWGNTNYLESFFSTILYWIPHRLTFEIEILNPISIQLNINCPSDQYLSAIEGFKLMTHYLKYIIAYFNGRAWISQQTINIVFPLLDTTYSE
ncbi:MAG: hypothetical protein ACFFAU_20065 [Candidatus Hodarchaeota archaeon]